MRRGIILVHPRENQNCPIFIGPSSPCGIQLEWFQPHRKCSLLSLDENQSVSVAAAATVKDPPKVPKDR
jgi:hypothetical protein